MDRRKFLKQVSLWSAGIILTPPVFDVTPELFAMAGQKPDIHIATGKDYNGMVRQIANAMGGFNTIVNKGDKVVIKPNIGWDRTIAQGANTHPQVVAETAKLCLEAGASKILIFDRTCNEERRCYHNSGMAAAVKELSDRRVKLEYVDDRKFVPVTIKNGTTLKEWSFYKDALAADCYINVPVAKHHSLSDLSIGLKNIMGVIGGRRGRIHFRLDKKLADLNRVIKPALTIVDATRVIIRNGPQGGNLKDVRQLDTIVASKDPVAADAYATTLFGKEPDDIGSTVAAHNIGLGQMDLSQCNLLHLKV